MKLSKAAASMQLVRDLRRDRTKARLQGLATTVLVLGLAALVWYAILVPAMAAQS